MPEPNRFDYDRGKVMGFGRDSYRVAAYWNHQDLFDRADVDFNITFQNLSPLSGGVDNSTEYWRHQLMLISHDGCHSHQEHDRNLLEPGKRSCFAGLL